VKKVIAVFSLAAACMPFAGSAAPSCASCDAHYSTCLDGASTTAEIAQCEATYESCYDICSSGTGLTAFQAEPVSLSGSSAAPGFWQQAAAVQHEPSASSSAGH